METKMRKKKERNKVGIAKEKIKRLGEQSKEKERKSK